MDDAPDNRLASVLAQDLRALLGKLKRRLREQAHVGDLTPSQVSVLLRLEKDGPATASQPRPGRGRCGRNRWRAVIAALEAAGLVSGAPDPTDGRQTLLSLTDACRQRVQEGRAARQDWLTRTIQARLSAAGTGRTRGGRRTAQAARRRLSAFGGVRPTARRHLEGHAHGADHARPEDRPDRRRPAEGHRRPARSSIPSARSSRGPARWPTPSARAACRWCWSTSPAARRAERNSRAQAGVPPEGWTDLIPELNRQPGDIVVTKRTWGAFASTDLEAQLKALGVTQVVDRRRRHRNRRRIDRAPGL